MSEENFQKQNLILSYIKTFVPIVGFLILAYTSLKLVEYKIATIEEKVERLEEEKADNQSVVYFQKIIERIEKKVDDGFSEIKTDIKEIKNKG